jgi:outer membrane protein assembly factor BamB
MTQQDHPLIAVHGMTVRAIDRRSGRLVWQYEAKLSIARFALAHGRVFALDDSCRIHCIDVSTGALLGMVPIDGPEWTGCALVADGDVLYAATTRSVVAISAEGRVVWRTEVGGAFAARAGLALPGNTVQPDFTGS